MALLGESDKIVELFEIHLGLRVLRRQFDSHKGNGQGVYRLLAGVFKRRRQAGAMCRLNLPQPPFGALRMAYEIARGEMARVFVHGHVGRIARILQPVDVTTYTDGSYPPV